MTAAALPAQQWVYLSDFSRSRGSHPNSETSAYARALKQYKASRTWPDGGIPMADDREQGPDGRWRYVWDPSREDVQAYMAQQAKRGPRRILDGRTAAELSGAVRAHGSIRAAAEALGVSTQTLSTALQGETNEPVAAPVPPAPEPARDAVAERLARERQARADRAARIIRDAGRGFAMPAGKTPAVLQASVDHPDLGVDVLAEMINVPRGTFSALHRKAEKKHSRWLETQPAI